MNNLRTPIGILVAIFVVLLGWYLFARSTPAQAPAPASTATTTSPLSGPQEPAQKVPPTTLDPSTVAANIAGTWQSTDDPNYSVAITANGSWTDSYKGANASSSVSETGTYELFTSEKPDKDFTGILVPGVIYVKLAEGTSVLYFSVVQASGSALQLNYLDRGNTLSFVKKQ